MIIKQNTPPAGLAISCDIPTLTAGVPAYVAPASIQMSTNGGALGATSSTIASSSQPGTNGPFVALLSLNAADFATLGSVDFVLLDGSSNVVGKLHFDVSISDLNSIPAATPGQSGGLPINGSNSGTLVFNSGVVIADGGLHIQNTSGNAVAIAADSGHASVLISSGAPGIEIDAGATGPGLKIQGGTDGIVVTAGTGRSVNAQIETNYDLVQSLRLILSALAGKVSISGNTVTIRDVNDTKDRIVATTDVNNERTAVTTNVS